MKLEDMAYDQLVDWMAGELLKRLLSGDFRTGVWLMGEQVLRWRQYQEENPKTPRRVVAKRKNGSPGKYENVCDSELSVRAKNALIKDGLTDAYAVRKHIKTIDPVRTLKLIPNIGTRIALEILDYYEAHPKGEQR